MDQIAFIYGETTVYWGSIVLALSILTGVLFFWAAYLWRSGNVLGAAAGVPVAIVLSVVLGRLIHWYCRADSYESLKAAMTNYASGSYALMGAFAGCLIAAIVLRLLKIVKNLPEMLDCISLSGCGAIALGRLACFFTSADRGQILTNYTKLPWAFPVLNTVSGVLEYRLATFLIQAIAVGCIFVILAAVFVYSRDERKLPDGDQTLLFLLLYGASQVVLDSTRYDSLYLRINGFVSIVQILGAIAIVLPIVVYSVRLVKAGGFKGGYAAIWLVIAALIGGAGYMEYYVQRHGNQARFAYTVMSTCLMSVIILSVVLWILALRKERLRRMPTSFPQ